MNRLNYTQMVNNTLLGQQGKKFFNVTQIHPDDYFESEIYSAKIKQTKESLNLDRKIRNVVLSVHEQLRVKSTDEKLKKKFNPKKQYHAIQEETAKKCSSIENVICENNSLPRKNVLCSDKHRDLAQISTETASNYLNFENHKRMLRAQQRKMYLENMIKEHKLLIEDRRSLEQDVLVMRHNLDEIQHRVNNSLQQLKNKKTFCESHGFSTRGCKDNKYLSSI